MRSIVVLDEHDEALQEERSPTWHARDVAIERARRARVCRACWSRRVRQPSLLHWAGDSLRRPSVTEERDGWPILELVDRTREEPWKRSLLTSPLIQHLRNADQRVICVHNTKGRARLLACRTCKSLQRCEKCQAAVMQDDAGSLVCRRCGTVRPVVCQTCGSGALSLIRPGVSRLREEIEAAAGRPVGVVTGDSDSLPDCDVLIGTEAVLHRAGRADVVAFLDLDAELLAPTVSGRRAGHGAAGTRRAAGRWAQRRRAPAGADVPAPPRGAASGAARRPVAGRQGRVEPPRAAGSAAVRGAWPRSRALARPSSRRRPASRRRLPAMWCCCVPRRGTNSVRRWPRHPAAEGLAAAHRSRPRPLRRRA